MSQVRDSLSTVVKAEKTGEREVTFTFDETAGTQVSRVTLSYDLANHPAYALEKLLPLPPSPLTYSLIVTDGNGVTS